MYPKSMRLSFFGLLLMLMALLVAACSNQATTSAAGSTAMLTAIATATPTSTAVKTLQSCPANGNGRAAVMPALTTPQHPSVAYVWWRDNTHVTMSKYDTLTGKKQNLLAVSHANVSPDGHWFVVNQAIGGTTNALKLMRVDGKYTQTLYCSTSTPGVGTMLLSPNQHYLIFDEYERNPNTMMTTYILKLLDLTTGKIHVVLSSLQPGYPGATPTQANSLQPQVQMSYTSQFMPLSGPRPITAYIPLKWASNSSLYLLGTPIEPSGGGAPRQDLYQLLDINTSVDQQSSNVKSLTASLQPSECDSYDITSDQTQIVCSVNPIMGPNTIIPAVKVKPISGGSWQTIFTAPLSSQVQARASSGQMILFTVNNVATHVAQLYRINTDGTQLKLLTSAPAAEYAFDSYGGGGGNSYLPWTNVSHDGKHYAILQTTNNKDSLIIGNINGISSTTTPVANNILTYMVGWTAA